MELLFWGSRSICGGTSSPVSRLAALQFVHLERAVLLVAKKTDERPSGRPRASYLLVPQDRSLGAQSHDRAGLTPVLL